MKRILCAAQALLLSLLLIVGGSIASVAQSQPVSGELAVHYLDVGQADSMLIELPNGETMLIDAGNNADGPAVVAAIRALEHERIDYVIATHPHEDHIGGMDDVINAFSIGKFYLPQMADRDIPTTVTFEEMLEAAADRGVRFSTAKAGVELLALPNLTARLIAPVEGETDGLNNYSAVLRLQYGETSFLFTGDAETAAEAKMTDPVAADVLKVGHHGSDSSTSQAFVDRVSPSIAIVSVGKDNSYGHPAADVLARLEAAGAAIYRTDLCGTVTVRSDGSTVSVETATAPVQPQAPPTASTGGKSDASSAVSPVRPAADPQPQSTTVYVTKTGSKYHTGGCSYLAKSKTAISLEAAKRSYGPCSRCHPPQ